ETVGGKTPPNEGEDGEAAMDIEVLSSLAPGIRIVVYQEENTDGAEAEILSAYVSQDVAKVMSSSWYACEPEDDPSEMAAAATLLQEAATQGQSFFVATGDWGATVCDQESKKGGEYSGLAVAFPPSDPFATGVGGTRLEDPTGTPVD